MASKKNLHSSIDTVLRQVESLKTEAKNCSDCHSMLHRELEGLVKELTKYAELDKEAQTNVLKKAKKLCQIHATWIKHSSSDELKARFFSNFDQVSFLFNTRLIYSIIAQQNCSKNEELRKKHEIITDINGLRLLTNVQDQKGSSYISVKDLMDKSKFEYNSEKACLVEVSNKKRSLNYFANGLESTDRWESDDFTPVARISPEEQKNLLEHARRFWTERSSSPYEVNRISKENPEKDTCIVQVFMCPRRVLNGNKSYVPVHAAIRIIDEEGNIYSTGFGSTIDEDKYNEGLRNYLATINGMPTLMDYEETREDEGRVTMSMSISTEQKQEILAKLKEYRTKGIRFNILLQNCTRLATQVLQLAGVKVDNKTNFISVTLSQLLPSWMKRTSDKVEYVWNNLPKPVQWFADLVFFPVIILYRILASLALLSLGGSVGSPIKGEESRVKFPVGDNRDELTKFTTAVSSIKDFSRDPLEVYHSTPLMRWMLAQPTACFAKYEGLPDLRVHAYQHDSTSLDKLREIYHVFDDQLARAPETRKSYDDNSAPVAIAATCA